MSKDLLSSGANMYMNYKYGPKLMVANAIADAVSGRKSPKPLHSSQGQPYPPQGYPPQPYPPPAYPPQAYPPQSYPPQGYPPQSYPPQSYPPQGYPPPSGYPPQGYPPPSHGGYGGQSHSSSSGHGGLMSTGSALLSQAGKVLGKAAGSAGGMMGKFTGGQVMSLLQTNNILQLISRTSGRALQIMQTPEGKLFLDGRGSEGPDAFNAHFTCHRVGENIIMLSNQGNFISIRGGRGQVISGPPDESCRLKVKEHDSHFISLKSDSVFEQHCHVSVLTSGDLKSAAATSSKDTDSHFVVKVIFSPSLPSPQPPSYRPY